MEITVFERGAFEESVWSLVLASASTWPASVGHVLAFRGNLVVKMVLNKVEIGVWVICYCVTNSPKSGSLKTTAIIYFAHKFVVWPGLALTISLCSAVSAVEAGLGAGESTSKMAHSHGWQVDAGCWLGALLGLRALVLPVAWASFSMVTGFQGQASLEKEPDRHSIAFYDLVSEVKQCCFHHAL